MTTNTSRLSIDVVGRRILFTIHDNRHMLPFSSLQDWIRFRRCVMTGKIAHGEHQPPVFINIQYPEFIFLVDFQKDAAINIRILRLQRVRTQPHEQAETAVSNSHRLLVFEMDGRIALTAEIGGFSKPPCRPLTTHIDS